MPRKIKRYWIWIDNKRGMTPHETAEVMAADEVDWGRECATLASFNAVLHHALRKGYICRVYVDQD